MNPTEQVQSGKTRLLVRNSLFLYVRMAISIVLSLFTSRIVLEQLGVDDFGVFSLVGSIVAAMNFLSNSVAGALSRFYAFSLGKKKINECIAFFNASLRIEIILGAFLFAALFFGGRIFIVRSLSLPAGTVPAAIQVLFWSALSFFVTLAAIPFKSAVIARERFGLFSVVELLLNVLKLIGILCLTFIVGSKLVLYAVVIFIATVMCSAVYVVYCFRRLPECSVKRHVSSKAVRELLSFSGFDLYGNFCAVVSPQANQWIINVFFGIAFNAAYGVTMQVTGAVNAFVSGLLQAFRPRIIKEYAEENFDSFNTLLSKCCCVVALMMGCITVPLFLNLDYVLNLWLKDVPVYTSVFCSVALLAAIPLSLTYLCNSAVHATGRIRSLSIVNGTLFILIPVISALMFRFGHEPGWIFIIAFFSYTLQWIVGILLIKRMVTAFDAVELFKRTSMTFAVIGGCLAAESLLNQLFYVQWHRLVVDTLFTLTVSWFFFTSFVAKEKTSTLLKTYFSRT